MGCGITKEAANGSTTTAPPVIVPGLFGAADEERSMSHSPKSFTGVAARATPQSQRSSDGAAGAARGGPLILDGVHHVSTTVPRTITPTSSGGSLRGQGLSPRKSLETGVVGTCGPSPLVTALTKVASTMSAKGPPPTLQIHALNTRATPTNNSHEAPSVAPPTMQAFDDGDEAEESASRGNFDEELGSGDCFDDVGSVVGAPTKPNLAIFRQDVCGACGERPIEYNCKQCNFGLCEDCFFSGNTGGHNELHEMEALEAHHCGGSRSNLGGLGSQPNVCDFSVTQLALSHFLYEPCKGCCRMIVDEETVYKCSTCAASQLAPFVVCEDCFTAKEFVHDEQHVMVEFSWTLGNVKERPVVSKGRNDEGNKVINDYTVVKELGRGSFAKVKLLQNVETKEVFAVKILKKSRKQSITNQLSPSRQSMMSPVASGHAIPDSVLKEIVVMRVLNHPNIVKLVEIIDDVESDKFYVIMEYCENGPLHTLGNAPLNLGALRTMGQHILRGLRYLHEHGLYHRDIKPANCLVDCYGIAKLADFGACDMKHISSYTDGTPAFMCPEMMRAEEVDGVVADSWAFAVTMYQAAYGSLPFPTLQYNAIQQMLVSDDEISFPATIPCSHNATTEEQEEAAQLEALLRAMLQKNIANRSKIEEAICHPFFCSMDALLAGSSNKKLRSPDNSVQPHADRHPSISDERSVEVSRDNAGTGAPLFTTVPTILVDDNSVDVTTKAGHQHPNFNSSSTTAFHPTFAPEVEDPLANSIERRAEIYARAMSLVKRGSKIHQSFHGLHRVKECRKNALAVIRGRKFEPGDEEEGFSDDTCFSGSDAERHTSPVQAILSDSTNPPVESQHPDQHRLAASTIAPIGVATTTSATLPPWSNSMISVVGKKRRSTTTVVNTSSGKSHREEAKLEKLVDLLLATPDNLEVVIKGVSLGNGVPDRISDALHCNLKSLTITDCKLSLLRGLNMPAFANLRDLNLSKNNFHAFPVELLRGCPKLQLLDLSFNRIKAVPDELHEAVFLERLSMHYNRVATFSAASLTGKHFHHLRLSDNPVTHLPMDGTTSVIANVKVVLDDAPSLMQQWAAMIEAQHSGGLSIIWNDVYPKQMVAGFPWFIAGNPLALYTIHQLRQLDIKHIIVPAVIHKYHRETQVHHNESDDSMRSSSMSSGVSNASSGRRRRRSSRKSVDGQPILKIPVLHPSAAKLFDGIHFVDSHGFIDSHQKPLTQFLTEACEEGAQGIRGNIMVCMDDSLPTSIGSTEDEQAEIAHDQRVIVASLIEAATQLTNLTAIGIREALKEARLGVYN